MRDGMPGPGWWIASDGRWYPPELHPDVYSPVAVAPTVAAAAVAESPLASSVELPREALNGTAVVEEGVTTNGTHAAATLATVTTPTRATANTATVTTPTRASREHRNRHDTDSYDDTDRHRHHRAAVGPARHTIPSGSAGAPRIGRDARTPSGSPWPRWP